MFYIPIYFLSLPLITNIICSTICSTLIDNVKFLTKDVHLIIINLYPNYYYVYTNIACYNIALSNIALSNIAFSLYTHTCTSMYN